jgi:hypothetical protein
MHNTQYSNKMEYIHTFIRRQKQKWQLDVSKLQSVLQSTSLPGILGYIVRNDSDIVILKCPSGAEIYSSISREELPVETDIIFRNCYNVAINSQCKFIYGMR